MRTWEEIKNELEEYKQHSLSLVSDFTKNDCVECNVDGNTYFGRVRFTGFDQEKGRAYVNLKLNKNKRFTWTTIGHEKQSKFHDDELNKIKLITNTFNKENYSELIDKLNELDDLPLSKSDREDKKYEIQKEIINLRQTSCIHDWEEVEEGSWLNSEVVGYKCTDCGLKLDKDQEIEVWEKQFEDLY